MSLAGESSKLPPNFPQAGEGQDDEMAVQAQRSAGAHPDAPAETMRALSLLTPEDVAALGALPGAAICGSMKGPNFAEANFRPNPVFIEIMQRTIASVGPSDPSLQDAARRQKEGFVYVIDLRTPEGPHELRHFAEPAPIGGDPETAARYRRVPYFLVMEWRKPRV